MVAVGINSRNQIGIAYQIVTLAFEEKVDDQQSWFALLYLANSLCYFTSVVQFGHVHQDDAGVHLDGVVALDFVVHISHREIIKGTCHGTEDG